MYDLELDLKKVHRHQSFKFVSISEIESNISNPYDPIEWGIYGLLWTGSKPYKHEFDGKVHTVPANYFVFISPHITNNFVEGDHSDAILLLFTSAFFARSSREAYVLQVSPLFHKIDQVFYYKNAIYGKGDLRGIISKILNKNVDEAVEGIYGDLTHTIISTILLYAMTQLKAEEDITYISDINTNDYELSLAFRKMVVKNHKQERTVTFYADALNIPSRNLTNACKKAFGKTAKELITEIVMENAFRKLSNSDLSIKEITFELGFTEETNFISFFRKQVGITPQNFRNRYN